VLIHRIHPVAPLLATYVEHLWMARGELASRWRNMIFPDGAVELMINLGDPQRLCDVKDGYRPSTFRHSWISGERAEPIVIDEGGRFIWLAFALNQPADGPSSGCP
jgi:hypothetical protein